MTDDAATTTLSPNDIEQADLEDWRVLFDALHARFRTDDFATGLKLVKKIGKAAEKADHHPDVDLSYGQVDVRLSSHDAGGVTERDVDLARQISGFASDVGAEPAPGELSVIEIALDTPTYDDVKPFWAAVLGYETLQGACGGAERPERHPAHPVVPEGGLGQGRGPAALPPRRAGPARGGREAGQGGPRGRRHAGQ